MSGELQAGTAWHFPAEPAPPGRSRPQRRRSPDLVAAEKARAEGRLRVPAVLRSRDKQAGWLPAVIGEPGE